MITRLTSEQVSMWWDYIVETIMDAAPEDIQENPLRLNNVLAALLKDAMQCWILTKGKDVYAVWLTDIMVDNGSGAKTLYIYTFKSLRFMTKDLWNEWYSHMKGFAAKNGCKRIAALTHVQRVIDVVTKILGGEAKYTLVTLEV